MLCQVKHLQGDGFVASAVAVDHQIKLGVCGGKRTSAALFGDFKRSRPECNLVFQLSFFRAEHNVRWYAAKVSGSSTKTMDRKRATIGVAGTR